MPNTFPRAWIELLERHSSLGLETKKTILAVERAVADREAAGATVYPLLSHRYRALQMVLPDQCVAAAIGQDPYHGIVTLPDGTEVPQATGLSFSVPQGAKLPPSLRNVFKELGSDLNVPVPADGDLTHWAKEQVLLNSVLTVEKNSPKSHDALGWQCITAAIVEAISRYQDGVVFIRVFAF